MFRRRRGTTYKDRLTVYTKLIHRIAHFCIHRYRWYANDTIFSSLILIAFLLEIPFNLNRRQTTAIFGHSHRRVLPFLTLATSTHLRAISRDKRLTLTTTTNLRAISRDKELNVYYAGRISIRLKIKTTCTPDGVMELRKRRRRRDAEAIFKNGAFTIVGARPPCQQFSSFPRSNNDFFIWKGTDWKKGERMRTGSTRVPIDWAPNKWS